MLVTVVVCDVVGVVVGVVVTVEVTVVVGVVVCDVVSVVESHRTNPLGQFSVPASNGRQSLVTKS